MKNGQYLTTVPKAWLDLYELSGNDKLEWDWDASKEGTVKVGLLDLRCKHMFSNGGKDYRCLLKDGHSEWHQYDGIKTVQPNE